MAEYPVVDKTLMPTFDARDLPPDVIDDCINHEISTHYENTIANVYWEDDGGPLVEWLKVQGIEFKDGSAWFGLMGT